MTNNLLQTIEEKVMMVLAEVESLRKEVLFLRQENTNLKSEQSNNENRLQGLVSLLDVLEVKGNDSLLANVEIAIAV